MASKRLIPPKDLNIDFAPSPRQYELWKLLQPECHLCGGEIEQKPIGYDQFGNQQFKPHCTQCDNTNIPQLILGGGAAGGGKSWLSGVWLISSCIRFSGLRAIVARKTLKSIKESIWRTIYTLSLALPI